jgi:hypothetical protein
VATKTPSKGKKAAGGEKVKSAPKKARAQKPAAIEAKEPELSEPTDVDDEDDEDLDDEEGEAAAAKPPAAAAATATVAAKKPAAKPASRGGQPGEEAPQVVPARRLTPEAKAKINDLVAKGMPLGEALRAAAAWETFVAPVREEPAKLVQGRSFDGGGGRPAGPRPDKSERAEREEDDGDDEEPNSPGGGSDDE